MTPLVAGVVLLLFSVTGIVSTGDALQLQSKEALRFFRRSDDEEVEGTRWAVLVAGSKGYWNCRHQADVCHAYQLLRKGGLKEENIIVFMYDDIAFNKENPSPGIIINNPHGRDAYKGVPKVRSFNNRVVQFSDSHRRVIGVFLQDYTGENITANHFFAAVLGNKTALTGGSGKIVDSGPNDHIFICYSDHGSAGIIQMPNGPNVYADDLIDVLKKKHASGTYKSLLFYLEACESGSMFEGLLPDGLNIYATTAANATESSWETYCPGDDPRHPSEYETCLGDLYSVAWMEDSDIHNLRKETLHQQYELVKKRTSNGNYTAGSHVMQYGDIQLSKDNLFTYLGTNPAPENLTFVDDSSLQPPTKAVNQRDADLVHF